MWSDIDWKKLKINIRRDWVDGQLGRPKSRASKAAVEMHETLAALLQGWRQETPYNKDSDFLFPSFKLHGKQPRLGQHDRRGLHSTCSGSCRGDPGRLSEVRFPQPAARSFDIPDRQWTGPGGGAAHASPVACGHDDALRAQQPQGEKRSSSIHRAFPAERDRARRLRRGEFGKAGPSAGPVNWSEIRKCCKIKKRAGVTQR